MFDQTVTPRAAAAAIRGHGGYKRIDHSTLFGGYVTAERYGKRVEIDLDEDGTWTGDERMLRIAGIRTAPKPAAKTPTTFRPSTPAATVSHQARCTCASRGGASSSIKGYCHAHGISFGYRFGRAT